ncbi:MAG: hypothetical protein P9M08_04530, partial [Candidatus Erginobacter occultus]|nr:hypothetical protein [Candidatus Erginobacter occultus]
MKITLSIVSLLIILFPAYPAFPLSLSLTGEEDSNRCEAHTYYISVENPAWYADTASSLIVTNTVPPDGFVFQNESAGITAPQGSLSGAGANPAVAGD